MKRSRRFAGSYRKFRLLSGVLRIKERAFNLMLMYTENTEFRVHVEGISNAWGSGRLPEVPGREARCVVGSRPGPGRRGVPPQGKSRDEIAGMAGGVPGK